MTDGIFDEHIARVYDADDAAMFAPEVLGPTVDFLADLAGIELSTAMVRRLEAKPGAERVPVTIGDMATTRVDGSFGLVYLVYNTISNLLLQEEQVACFRNAAAHLDVDGHFVVEVFVPALRRLPPGERFVAFDVSDGHIGVDEYDLMAHIAGLTLVERWSDWRRTPFSADSTAHVSVWRKTAA